MKVLKHLPRAVPAIYCLLAVTGANAADTTRAALAEKPAAIVLDIPARGHVAAAQFPVATLSYDVGTGVPLRSVYTRLLSGVRVEGTVVVGKGPPRLKISPGTQFPALTIVESNDTGATVRRIDFRTVTITSVGPAGDGPGQRITFSARSLHAR